jgi:SAM-dependent methyltransferase
MSRVRVLTPTDDPRAFPEEWYALATADHFWMRWRMTAFLRLLKDEGLPFDASLRGLEIGCGGGVLRRALEDATAWTVDGADIDRRGLEASPELRGESLLYDASTRDPQLRERYDFVVLFDVIEHVADDRAMIADALFHLKPGGRLFVNVPALESLRSRYDDAAGHLRRYDRRSLREALRGLEVDFVGYWGLSMVPLLAARKLVLARAPEAEVIRRGFAPPGRLADGALKALMRLETAVSAFGPAGTSLMAAARKPAAGANGS